MRKEKVYKISENELRKLIKDKIILSALEAAGVDNWQGYSEAFGLIADIYLDEDEDDIYYAIQMAIDQKLTKYEKVI